MAIQSHIETFGPVNRQFWGTAPPTGSGTAFLVGDLLWNTSPLATGVLGWICTTAGTPGVWTAMSQVVTLGSQVTVLGSTSTPILVNGNTVYVQGSGTITTISAAGLYPGLTISLIPGNGSTSQGSSSWTTATGGNIIISSLSVWGKVLYMEFDGSSFYPSY